ncbi:MULTISPECIES: 2-dehydro-3-deoxygalactonokinase [Sphingomonas]|jgi:2-dehydro-3-deoxygalactonokinase
MTGLIGIDWGTSNLRGFRFDAHGTVIERRASPRGIATIEDGAFEAVLGELVAGWTGDRRPIVLSGMIGSRNGWREAAYLPCPADPVALAAATLGFDTALGRCHIVPGLAVNQPGRPGDVMRGEETQILGAGVRDGILVLPGTHSKWATLEAGRVTGFRTAMTGELYAVLLRHSLLGRLAEDPGARDTGAGFARGVERALADPALSLLLFSARAEVLLGGLSPQEVAAYLSGLLIGAEIGAMIGSAHSSITMIGDPALSARYRTAFGLAGRQDINLVDGDAATAAGLWTIGKEIR